MARNTIASRLSWLATGLCVAFLSACGGGSVESNVPAPTAGADNPDLDIAKLAYSPDARVPAGFYTEPRRYPDRSEFLFHVKNVDLGILADNAYELCTDDFAEALQWSEQSATARGFDSDFSSSEETAWLFGFERTINDPEGSMLLNRVFKCAALDRSALADDSAAGQVNRSPVTAVDLKFLSEYLWQFSPFNNALNAVVESAAADTEFLAHDIHRVVVRVGEGSINGCDSVELWRWRHSVDSQTGELTETDAFQRAFDARRENGIVALCGE
ncbi:MAG: hypothetical protein AAAFM81_06555 [Pseudomonadota bacterium]